jgi:hypothetical protein
MFNEFINRVKRVTLQVTRKTNLNWFLSFFKAEKFDGRELNSLTPTQKIIFRQ